MAFSFVAGITPASHAWAASCVQQGEHFVFLLENTHLWPPWRLRIALLVRLSSRRQTAAFQIFWIITAYTCDIPAHGSFAN